MTPLHWIVVAIFAVLFFMLVILSSNEKNTKTLISMIFSSFLLVVVGSAFSLFALDKYTKEAKLLSSSQTRDYSNESVIIRGKIKNIGKFKIGYCNVEVRMINPRKRGGKISYFTPSKTLSFGSKSAKGNVIEEEFLAIKNIEPKKSKNFKIIMDFPPHFANPEYKLKLFCH
jgi:hypothetical protein